MKIAMISTPFLDTPPKKYGGTERIVSYLTEELVKRNHNVSLFATKDSVTSANLFPLFDRWNEENDARTYSLTIIKYFMILNELLKKEKFDIIICNNHNFLEFIDDKYCPVICILHNDVEQSYNYYKGKKFIAISNNQRERMKPFELDIIATIHNFIDVDYYEYTTQENKYLAFIGAISADKGCDICIDIARSLQLPLKIAGRIGALKSDQVYYKETIEPYLDGDLIEYIGELNDREKNTFLKNAKALLFPIRWEEPFGLVMIEAMACGTPVIAYKKGSVPEIILDEKVGFIVNDQYEMMERIADIESLRREDCRVYVKEKFSLKSQVDQYEALFHQLLG